MAESATESGEALHKAAEEKAALMPEPQGLLSSDEVRQVLQDVRILRIELEMQNDELRWAQAELEATQARYFHLYEQAPVGFFTLSDAGLVLEANLTAANLLGVARGTLLKQPLTRFILPEDRNIYYRHRQKLLATNKPQSCELRLVKRDGSLFLARLEATAAQGVDGAPEHLGQSS